MPDNIEIVDGVASFFSNRLPAWHNLGEIVDGALTWEDAINKAHMNWEVVKRQLSDPFTGNLVDTFGIFRTDTQQFLGNVGDRYTPIQNTFQFQFMDKVLGEGNAHYETAGILGKGERVFMLANLAEEYDIMASGDKHKAYLAGVGSHDGSTSQRFFTTEVRIVCANTLQIALSQAKGAGVSVKHTAKAESRINKKLNVLAAGRDAFVSTMEMLEILAQRSVDSTTVVKTIADLFGVDAAAELPTKTINSINTIKDLFEGNDNNAFPEFRGTAYNLLNAITEYTDHFKPIRMTAGREGQSEEQVRSDSAMFGLGADFKRNALQLVIDNTANSSLINQPKTISLPAGTIIH